MILYAGDLEVFNSSTKRFARVEGVHQTDEYGNTTYYIKADKLSRSAQQIYMHEKFHEIVSANPGLLGDLVRELEAQYGKQEIAALVNSYVEAYDGIYGRFDESMTADEQETLIMQYMNEVFADVYAGIHRGRANTAKAKQIMDSQTTEIQRAAQNRKAMQNKNAPPEQRFAIGTADVATLRSIGRKSVNDFTSDEIRATEQWARKFYAELGTKSPFFRAWFGDWRKYDSTPVKVLSLHEAKTAPAGKSVNEDTGTIISWGRDYFRETAQLQRRDGVATNVVGNAEEIIRNAIYLDTEISMPTSKRKMQNTAFMHHFYILTQYDGKTFLQKLYAEEAMNNQGSEIFVRAYTLKDIKEIAQIPNSVLSDEGGLTGGIYATEISVADLFEIVKQYDPEFKPKRVNPVLLNEDGTPKVFYHGTGERFTEFSSEEMSPREGSFFFAENREDAQAYGKNVMAVYLTGNNFANYDDQPSEFYRLRNKREQVQWLKERGYDGWYADMDSEGWGEVSVFSQGQIKSATDNIGTFNAGNADIRYSFDDDVAELDAGLGTGGQVGSVAEGSGGSVAGGKASTQAAIISNVKKNGRAQSARSIGVENGSEDASLYVLSDEDIAQSEQWQKIKANAEVDGANVVLFAGDLKVFNPATKNYARAEGLYQTDENGNTTYYIKVDKHSRSAQQIYLHESFHAIVNANPQILSNLVKALEAQYNKQEIAALLSSYIEVYGGIYGRFSDSMTEKEQKDLAMKYWGEVFADVYAGIRRGRANTAKAKQIMDSQTTEIQRAAQNRKAMQNKNAPPEQKFSYKGYARQRKYATIKVSPQEYAQIQSARMSKYTTYHQEMTDLDGIFAHDMFYLVKNDALDKFDVLKRLDPGKNQELIEIVMEELENGNIGDATDAHRFNEMLRRIKGKRNRNRNHDFGRSNGGTVDGMVSGAEGTSDRSGDLSGGDRGGTGNIKQSFSLDSPIEETRDLIAVHNVRPGNLERTIELGGFPMPSIAIEPAKVAHTGFGSISVIFKKDTINPESNSKNFVYDRDAWTPRVPDLSTGVPERTFENLGIATKSIKQEVIDKHGADFYELMESISEISLESTIREIDRMKAMEADYAEDSLQRELENLEIKIWKSLPFAVQYFGQDIFKTSEEQRIDSWEDVVADEFWKARKDESADYYIERAEIANKNASRRVEGRLEWEKDPWFGLENDEQTLSEYTFELVKNYKHHTIEEYMQAMESQPETRRYARRLTSMAEIKDEKETFFYDDYFEAKPHRVVSFDEIAAIVVPDDIKWELTEKLENIGARIISYTPKSNTDRLRAINSIPEVRFSVEDDVAELDAGYARHMAEDDTPEGLAPDDDKIDDYHALAKEEKQRRAKNATAEQRYSLEGYSEYQIENWKNSKRIVVFQGETQLSQFVRDATEVLEETPTDLGVGDTSPLFSVPAYSIRSISENVTTLTEDL